METILFTLLGALAVMLTSLAGVITFSATIKHHTHRILHFLPSLAAGVFLVIIFDLVFESREILSSQTELLLWFLLGFLALAGIAYFIPDTREAHTHEGENCDIDSSSRGYGRARRTLVADGIHTMADGIILATAFSVDVRLGFGVLLGVFVHELVQELSEYFVLVEAGYTRKEALTRNFLVSFSIFIGIGIAFFLHSFGERIEGILLAISAGAFFFVVARDLIPHSLRKGTEDIAGHIASFVIGVSLMLGVSFALPHGHGHGEDHADEHSEEVEHGDEDGHGE